MNEGVQIKKGMHEGVPKAKRVARRRRLLTSETSPLFSVAQRFVLAHASNSNPKRSSPRHNRPQSSQATLVSATVVGDVSLCDLHSPSSHAQLELLPHEPQGHLSDSPGPLSLVHVLHQSSDSLAARPPKMVERACEGDGDDALVTVWDGLVLGEKEASVGA
ncbi:hypothetical protein DEO72_LG8g1904 [Vigna unguiculata]|uniref:Uncharacterized protein n=1 Tax=Vigna unguiculata TaxID=3917 RepID=A0A4D6MVF1_VIGUN|nr:hypothetical protein DEO72_LG8g1904 [Vigna unguiculata]